MRVFTVTGAEVSEYPSESWLCYHLEPDGDEGPQEGDRLVLVSEAREAALAWIEKKREGAWSECGNIALWESDLQAEIDRLFPGGGA